MKTTLFLLAFFALLAGAGETAAQQRTVEKRTRVDSTTTVVVSETEDITPRRHMLFVNPLKFFLAYNLTYLHRLSPKLAVGVGAQIPTIEAVDGFGLLSEARFYASNRALRGFYGAPMLTYSRYSVEDGRASDLAIGFVGGWQWFAGRDFGLGLSLGAKYHVISGHTENEDIDLHRGVLPSLRFTVGYAW